MKFKSNAKCGQPVEIGSVFECNVGNTRISVHRIIHCDGWFLSCADLRISQRHLKSETLMGAINESKEVLKSTLESLTKDIKTYCEESAEISRY